MDEIERLVEQNGVGSLVQIINEIAKRQGYDSRYTKALDAAHELYCDIYSPGWRELL